MTIVLAPVLVTIATQMAKWLKLPDSAVKPFALALALLLAVLPLFGLPDTIGDKVLATVGVWLAAMGLYDAVKPVATNLLSKPEPAA